MDHDDHAHAAPNRIGQGEEQDRFRNRDAVPALQSLHSAWPFRPHSIGPKREPKREWFDVPRGRPKATSRADGRRSILNGDEPTAHLLRDPEPPAPGTNWVQDAAHAKRFVCDEGPSLLQDQLGQFLDPNPQVLQAASIRHAPDGLHQRRPPARPTSWPDHGSTSSSHQCHA